VILGPDLARELAQDDPEPGALFVGLAVGCALELASGLVGVALLALLLRWLR
jgi:hypothetical protein